MNTFFRSTSYKGEPEGKGKGNSYENQNIAAKFQLAQPVLPDHEQSLLGWEGKGGNGRGGEVKGKGGEEGMGENDPLSHNT